jgi:O-antigen/teichoic acid export membrane protein
LSFGIKILNQALTFAISIFLAQALGAEGLGLYSVALSSAMIVSVVVSLGMPNLLVRDLAKHIAGSRHGAIRGLIGRSIILVTSMWVIAAVLGAVAYWINPSLVEARLAAALALGLLAILFTSLNEIMGAILRAIKSPVIGQIPHLILQPGFHLLLLLGSTIWMVMSPQIALVLLASSAAISLCITAYIAKNAIPPSQKETDISPTYGSLLAAAVPFALFGGMQMIYMHTDIVMVGSIAGLEDAGHYRIASKGATLVVFALSAINMFSAPLLARSYEAGHIDLIMKISRSASLASMVFAVIALATFALFGELLIGQLFGDEFLPALPLLLILCGGQFVNAACGPVGLLLNSAGHERTTVAVLSAAAAANVALNAILIPIYGATGAAIATSSTFVLWNVWLVVIAQRKLGFSPLPLPRFSGFR